MRRYLIDTLGNYVFFVPLVLLFTPVLWNIEGIKGYALAAIPISLVGARSYTWFLGHIWYPLWKETF